MCSLRFFPVPYKLEAEFAGMKKFEANLTVQVQQSRDHRYHAAGSWHADHRQRAGL
jgi:hypothetical protein